MGPSVQAEGGKKGLNVDWDELPFSLLFLPRTLHQRGYATHQPGQPEAKPAFRHIYGAVQMSPELT